MDKWLVYILINNQDIVYVGITTNIVRRRSQHQYTEKIEFNSHRVIIHGLDKETAQIIEGVLIHFACVDLGLKLKNQNHNPLYNVWNLSPIKEQFTEHE